jgi:uncharacterized protein
MVSVAGSSAWAERKIDQIKRQAISRGAGVLIGCAKCMGDYREAIAKYIRAEAQPPDKLSHSPRLYRLARELAEEQPFDDDVVYAAAWLHDIGVYIGHRPADPEALARWDNVAYAVAVVPSLLKSFEFPGEKIAGVIEVIRQHLPSGNPTTFEGTLLRDADILEQLGAIGILRAVSKVGRDTRYPSHLDALRYLQTVARNLPGQLKLPSARRLAERRIELMERFFKQLKSEAGGEEFLA